MTGTVPSPTIRRTRRGSRSPGIGRTGTVAATSAVLMSICPLCRAAIQPDGSGHAADCQGLGS